MTQSICYYPFWGKSILILGKKLFLEIAQYQEVLLCVRKVTKEDVRKMPQGSIHERLAWGARKSEMENQQRKKNKTKNRGMER